MPLTESVQTEQSILRERDENTTRLAREDTARGRLCCPECGSPSGMIDLKPWALRGWQDDSTGPQFYTHGNDDALYTPCDECNWPGIIPPTYHPLTGTVGEWLERRGQ